MRLLGMLALLLWVTAANAATLKPVWICANWAGAQVAQDHQCEAGLHFVRGFNGAQPPQIVEQPHASAAQSPATARAPLFTHQEPGSHVNPFAALTRLIWHAALFLMIFVVVITAFKVYLIRAGQGFLRSLVGEATSAAAKAVGPKPVKKVPKVVAPKDAWTDVDRLGALLTESLREQKQPSAFATRTPPSFESDTPKPTEWTLAVLRDLEWKRFEEVCEGFWKAKGYDARLTGPGADGGVDVILPDRQDASKVFAIIQCKSLTSWVGVEPVRALWGAKDHFGAKMAIFYGVSGFSSDAKAFAAQKHLVLVDGAELLKQVLTLPPEKADALLMQVTRGDYRTPSCPKCEKKMVRRTGKNGRGDFWSCQTSRVCRTGMLRLPTP